MTDLLEGAEQLGILDAVQDGYEEPVAASRGLRPRLDRRRMILGARENLRRESDSGPADRVGFSGTTRSTYIGVLYGYKEPLR